MGLETAALIGIGAGGVGGAITGAMGTPDQQTNLKAKTPEQLAQERLSAEEFAKARQMAGQFEQSVDQFGGLSQAGQDQLMALLSGQGMMPTESELEQIQRLRDMRIQAGRVGIEQMLTPQLQELSSRLAQRGVRGQAATELQGRTLGAAGDALARLIAENDALQAQQQIAMPMQRAQMQAQLGQFAAPLRAEMQQRAIQNRLAMQNPALLQLEERARLAQPIQPGQPGGLGGALGGFFGGAGQMFGTVGSGLEGFGAAKKAGLF